jgi:hypothetical protein
METLEAAQNMQSLDVKIQHETTRTRHARFPRLPRSISVFVAGQRPGEPQPRPELERVSNPAADPALATLDRVLQELAAMRDRPAYVDTLFPEHLYQPGQLTVRVLTGEADGIEQHVIHEAQRQGLPVDLVVPDTLRAALPWPARRSVALGCPPDVLRETEAPDAMRDELALRYADVLVAVWDGVQRHGNAGRIVHLIQHAVEAGLPVLWIDTTGATRKVAEALVTDHRLYQLRRPEPEDDLLKSLFEDCDLRDGVVIEPLQRRLNPLQENLVVPNRETSMLARYAAERSKHAWLEARAGFLHNALEALFSFDAKKLAHSFVKLARGAHGDEKDAMHTKSIQEPSSAASAQDSGGDLHPYFGWTDMRATFAGEKHRSAIWQLYIFSALAVLASVRGILTSEEAGRTGVGPWIELALLVSIVFVYGYARRRRWHRFWLGHRFMAEQFRYLQMLQPFFAVPGPFQEPLFVHSDSSGGAHLLRSAELWILQRVLSAVGLPTLYRHYEFASADRRKLAQQLQTSIDEQLVFHKRSYKSARRLREMLEKLANWLFVFAGLFTLFHVIGDKVVDLPRAVRAFVAIFCAASPAFAAALHGVMTKLEIGRVAVQSAQVRTRLFVLRTAVSNAMESVAPVDWFSMACLRDDAMEVAMLLSRENERWRDLIRYQETEIPA